MKTVRWMVAWVAWTLAAACGSAGDGQDGVGDVDGGAAGSLDGSASADGQDGASGPGDGDGAADTPDVAGDSGSPPDTSQPGDATDASPGDAALDAVADSTADTADTAADDASADVTDAGPDTGDAATLPPVCSAPPAVAPVASTVFYDVPTPQVGVDPLERPLYEAVREAALADPDLHFVATWDHDAQVYRVDAAGGFVAFERTPAGIAVVEGDPASVFPSTAAEVLGDYASTLAAFENPSGYTGADLGYVPGDPRVGFLPPELESFPAAFERIAALFDSPDAPDVVVGHRSWSAGPGGSHGALSAVQSRATLVISGRGAKKGVVLEAAATLPDVAPTILAALGAGTTSGRGPDGVYDDGLFMERQDGRVLWEALADDPCDRPRHAILLLFDGLSQTELLHQALAGDAAIPTLKALVDDGVAWRYGATVNYPSVSAPGHMTAGSGVWSGHHGIISNAFYRRSAKKDINPFALLDDVQATLADPLKAVALYEEALMDGFQTLAQAAHARFGDFDPATGEGAFVAVINELPIGGADWTTVHLLLGAGPGPLALSLQEYEMADNLAVTQVANLLGDTTLPAPLILQMSLVKTDGAGETDGPHGDGLRQTLEETDGRVAAILKAYADRGVLEDTLVVLVSDHGMELQDPLRTTSVGKAVSSAGVKARIHSPGLVWFPVLELHQAATDGGLVVTVRDHDNGAPVSGATVSCDDCAPAVTDAGGVATLSPGPGATVVTATHPSFNPQQAPLAGP